MVFFNFEYYGFTSVAYNTELYEIVPGFILGIVSAIVVSIYTEKPSEEVVKLFDEVKDFRTE